jgi:general secretion pathway protein H
MKGSPVSPAIHARTSAEAISGALRSARSEAVMHNRSVQFTLDLGRRSYRWGDAPAGVLPADLRLALLASEDQIAAQSIGGIRFNPDGSSSGGRIAVTGAGRSWWGGVDWLSGRVSVVEKTR